MNLLVALFSDYTFQVVCLGTIILGTVAGSLGTFAVLRQQSLLGDCIAHAALPGICIAFLLTSVKTSFVLVCGALFVGGIAAYLLALITHHSPLKMDSALGVVLSGFFGFGLVLLTYIQQQPNANQSGLDMFLFGNAATMLIEDIIMMSFFAGITLTLTVLFWKEFKCICFHADYAHSLGLPTQVYQYFLTVLLVVSIVIGLQAVGVVLMSALIIAPAVAARQWTDQLGKMFVFSGIFGAISSFMGVVISAVTIKVPTGPIIVLVVSVLVIISLLLAPKRGLFWGWFRHHRQKRSIHEQKVLQNLLLFTETQTDPFYAHPIQSLDLIGEAAHQTILNQLKNKGLVHSPQKDHWGLTKMGYKKAKKWDTL